MHRFLFAVLLIAGAFFAAQGQHLPGTNDPSFNTEDVVFSPEEFHGYVQAMALQSDGKIVIGGSFSAYNGTARNSIARLNADGSLDDSFDPGSGFDFPVNFIVLQSDNKMIVGGHFTSFNGNVRNSIVRLNTDGSLDESFDPGTGFSSASGTGFSSSVNSIALQSDGKIVVGGRFTSFNGIGRSRIARLNTDGSLDDSFDPGTGFSFDVKSIALQSDGNMIVGGAFTTFNGTSRNLIARLDGDGSLDESFDPGTGFSTGGVTTIALQSDGKIIVGGAFASYNGTGRSRIARLNTDGSLDDSFDPGTGFSSEVKSIAIQSDGKMIVGGLFTIYNGTSRRGIARLHADGSLDNSFDPGTGFNNQVNSVTLQSNGKVIAGGDFIYFNGLICKRIMRLEADGSKDNSFNPRTGFDGSVTSIARQRDGKLIVGGQFTSFNSTPRSSIARLHADGSLDDSFDPGAGFNNNNVWAIASQSDGKMIVGGLFTAYNGKSRRGIARLHADGSLDDSFNPGTGFNNIIRGIALQSDGKMIVGGDFTSFNGMVRNRIARLNADGTLDDSFDPGSGFDNRVTSFVLQSDGKIVVGGFFNSYNGTPRLGIARLLADGSLDESFTPFNVGSGLDVYVGAVALQNDGKLVMAWWEMSYDLSYYSMMARLNADGSEDTSFNRRNIYTGQIHNIILQSDNKLVVGGHLTSFNGIDRQGIGRLHTDGSLDATFDPGNGFNGIVYAMSLQSDGSILVGGTFTSYDDIPRTRIARLYGGEGTALSAGTDQQPELDVLVYPNPSQGDILVEVTGADVIGTAVELVLYNSLGRQVFSKKATAAEARGRVKLPTTGLASGVYFLTIRTRSGVVSKRVVLAE